MNELFENWWRIWQDFTFVKDGKPSVMVGWNNSKKKRQRIMEWLSWRENIDVREKEVKVMGMHARVYFVDITHFSWPQRALRWRKLITCCQDSIRIIAGEGFDKNSIVLHSRGMDVSQISHKAITLHKGELQKYGADYPRPHFWKGALSSFGQNVKMQLHAARILWWYVFETSN